MVLLPASFFARAAAAVWLALCLALLVFAYAQREVHDMPVAFTWLLIALTFPIGLPTAGVVSVLAAWVSESVGLAYSPFLSLLPMWLATVAIGYLQWFVLCPAIARRLLRGRR